MSLNKNYACMAVSCFPFFPSSRIFVSLEDRVSLRFENIPETLALELLFFSFDRVAQKDESTNIQRRF